MRDEIKGYLDKADHALEVAEELLLMPLRQS
jgi:hypothetical protein